MNRESIFQLERAAIKSTSRRLCIPYCLILSHNGLNLANFVSLCICALTLSFILLSIIALIVLSLTFLSWLANLV